LIGSTETTTRRKSLTSSEYNRLSKERPAVLSYFLKEVRLLLRTPTYFINCIMTNLLVPVILAIPFLIQSQSDQQLLSLAKLTAKPDGQTILMVILVGVIMFLVSSIPSLPPPFPGKASSSTSQNSCRYLTGADPGQAAVGICIRAHGRSIDVSDR
jgi:hypothetical protein